MRHLLSTLGHRILWAFILATVPLGYLIHTAFSWWCRRSSRTHLMGAVAISPIMLWGGFVLAKDGLQAWWFFGADPQHRALLAVLVPLMLIVSVLLAAITILVVVQQKARHWQHAHPDRFHAARNLWTSLVLAHHHVVVEDHTTLRFNRGAMHIGGAKIPATPRKARRAIVHATAHAIGMAWRERLHLSASLWCAQRLGTTFLYTPPSAHAQLRTRTILRDAQAGRLSLLLTPTTSLA